jgi:hypothetical protein
MKVPQIVEELSRLMQLEIDAIAAYDAAVASVPPGPVHDELSLFRVEHQRHALALYDLFMRLGQNPPEVTPDVKGCVIGALTPPRPRLTQVEILEAMRGNEQLASSVYAKALTKAWPQPIREVLERARGDERQHLDWIERAISRQPWASGSGSAAHP